MDFFSACNMTILPVWTVVPVRRPPPPIVGDMPATLTDAHDHFTELFGTKRGANRPEQEAPVTLDSSGVLCAGGCGARVMPTVTGEHGTQGGPWYCEECFAAAKEEYEARMNALGCGAPKIASPEASHPKLTPTPSRMRSTRFHLPGETGILIGSVLIAALVGALIFVSFLQIETPGQWRSREQATIATHLRAARPHASQIKCQVGAPYKKPRCLFHEGSSAQLAVFTIDQHEKFILGMLIHTQITSVGMSIRPYNATLEEHREEVAVREQERT